MAIMNMKRSTKKELINMPPQAKKIEQIRTDMENKYELQNNNPKGNNQYTPKKDLVKVDKVLSEIGVFEKLDKGEQYKIINKMGNDLWKEGKDIRAKKAKFTMMQKLFFGWDFKED